MTEIKIVVIQRLEEDFSIQRLAMIARQPHIAELKSSFIMDVADGCCSSPFRVGQSIKLTPSIHPILIKKGSNIFYDVQQKTWNIQLPKSYCWKIEPAVKREKEMFGYTEVKMIQ